MAAIPENWGDETVSFDGKEQILFSIIIWRKYLANASKVIDRGYQHGKHMSFAPHVQGGSTEFYSALAAQVLYVLFDRSLSIFSITSPKQYT